MTARQIPPVLVAVVGLAILGAFIAWRLRGEHAARPAFHAVVLNDRSGSVRDGCDSVVGLAQQVLTEHGSAGDVTLTLLTTGDAASVNEPVEVARYSVSASHRALEGRGVLARTRENILQGVTARCTRLVPTAVSPIYLGIRRALEHLQALGCDAPNECRLLVATDAKETVEPALVAALRGERADAPALLLSNRSIAVLVCGLAATTMREDQPLRKGNQPRKSPAPSVELVSVWRALFAEPETVRFEPYCLKGGEEGRLR